MNNWNRYKSPMPHPPIPRTLIRIASQPTPHDLQWLYGWSIVLRLNATIVTYIDTDMHTHICMYVCIYIHIKLGYKSNIMFKKNIVTNPKTIYSSLSMHTSYTDYHTTTIHSMAKKPKKKFFIFIFYFKIKNLWK